MRSQASCVEESCIAPGTKLGLQRSQRHIALVRSQRSIGSNCTKIPCLWVHPRVWTLSSSRKRREPLVPEIYQLFPHEHRQGATGSVPRPGHCKELRREYPTVPRGVSRLSCSSKSFCLSGVFLSNPLSPRPPQ